MFWAGNDRYCGLPPFCVRSGATGPNLPAFLLCLKNEFLRRIFVDLELPPITTSVFVLFWICVAGTAIGGEDVHFRILPDSYPWSGTPLGGAKKHINCQKCYPVAKKRDVPPLLRYLKEGQRCPRFTQVLCINCPQKVRSFIEKII